MATLQKKLSFKIFLATLLVFAFVLLYNLDIEETFKSLRRKHSQGRSIKGNYVIKKILPRKGVPIFTQGLTFLNQNTLIESGGLYGQSSINYIDYPSLNIRKNNRLPGRYFAEGIDYLYDNKGNLEIYQLTYMEKEVLVYDKNFKLIRSIPLPKEISEGWGLAKFIDQKNETKFLFSDGSESIFVVNPRNFAVERVITPFSRQNIQAPGNNYNELEVYDNRIVLSNVWTHDIILAIDIQTGEILKVFDMLELKNYVIENNLYHYVDVASDSNYCLNGIAYNSQTKSFLVTGKKWSYMFDIEFQGL